MSMTPAVSLSTVPSVGTPTFLGTDMRVLGQVTFVFPFIHTEKTLCEPALTFLEEVLPPEKSILFSRSCLTFTTNTGTANGAAAVGTVLSRGTASSPTLSTTVSDIKGLINRSTTNDRPASVRPDGPFSPTYFFIFAFRRVIKVFALEGGI